MTTKTAIADLSKTVLSAKTGSDLAPFLAFIEERKAAGYPTAIEYMISSLALAAMMIRDRLQARLDGDKQVVEEALARLTGRSGPRSSWPTLRGAAALRGRLGRRA